ncbi:MAG: NADH-quinone oxidoreductase subunit L [Opitutaceae bacterium]|jgi:NADH-quinone oxidoreductase subunit L
MTPATTAVYILLAPLASAALIALFLGRRGAAASAVSVAAAAFVAVAGLSLAFGGARFGAAWEWLRFGSFAFTIGFKFDDLAALMLSVVGVIGLCVHVYSLGYMRDDAAKSRYFGGLSVFMFSMVGIVLADNLFMMFIFWELVGFSSYFLINHWRERQSASDAAKKAFIVNRVGDFGFLLGIILCYWSNGTVSLSALGADPAGSHAVYSRLIPLLLFCGAVGKSAQLPLQVWLPDAMEGPTPVSALIHAATMVAAGIYMLCRINVLMVPQARVAIAWVGTLTALYAALCAVTQRDIKKVLAYSTVSQLGYMVAAFGLGSVGAAMFHLTTHAFFKALLFLGAGSAILGCHHEQDIFRMGGLRTRMPVTFWTFTVAVAAIAGMPGLAGFFSKDAILVLAFEANRSVFAVLAFTAILTAFYMLRLWKIVFLGAPRSEAAGRAHEQGIAITAPLVLLAALSAVGGYWRAYPRAFEGVFSQIPEAQGSTHAIVLAASVLVLVAGAGTALAFYSTDGVDSLERGSHAVFGFLAALRSSFDRGYDFYVAKVQQRAAMVLNFIDVVGLSGVVVRGLAGATEFVGFGFRRLHTGRLSNYVYWFLGGVVVLWAYAAGLL